MLLIGSRALLLRSSSVLIRKPLDFDFICTDPEYNEWARVNAAKIKPTKTYDIGHTKVIEGETNCEFEIITPGSSAELLNQLVEADKDTIDTDMFGKVPNLDLLFTIKTSHRYKKFHSNVRGFYKHAIDWHRMRAVGAKVRPEYTELLRLREKETYTNKLPKLAGQTKDSFFKDDAIDYRYIHDDLHRVVALNEKPAYEYYLRDGSEVNCDRAKWETCSRFIKLSGVCEEACTLGLERGLIIFGTTIMNPEQYFKFALAKVCTSITGGWFREFAFENLPEVLDMYPKYCANYYDKFLAGIRDGAIRTMDKGIANGKMSA